MNFDKSSEQYIPQPVAPAKNQDSRSGFSLDVPSDPRATYQVIEKGVSGDYKTITTKRIGTSGVTYSRRAYDCQSNKVMYLGTGDSYEEMSSSSPDENMSEIMPQSIADYVGREACR